MEKNDSLAPQERENKEGLRVKVSLLVTAVLLVADLYVIINLSKNYLAVIGVTILFLVSVYFFINTILQELDAGRRQAQEQYEAVLKSGKANYLQMKKAFDQLEEIDNNTRKPGEDLITAQRAIAKVTITRNKENTDALMNSNDKVLERIFDFEERMGTNQNEFLDKQRYMIDDSTKELVLKQQEMAESMREIEASIRSELLQVTRSIEAMQGSLSQPAFTGTPDTETAADSLDLGSDIGLSDSLGLDSASDIGISDSLDLGSDIGLSDSLDLGSDIGLSDSIDLGVDIGLEAGIDLGSDIGFEDSIDLGVDIGLEDGIDLGSDIGFEDSLDLGEDIGLEDGVSFVEEPQPEPEPEPQPEPQPQPKPEPQPQPEPQPEKQDAPDLSDPHKLMTPDEIAALIANL